MREIFLLAALLILHSACCAQDKNPVKFGKIKPEDFNLSAYSYDTTAGAVVISDLGKSYYESNARGGFDVFFKRSTRIKILKSSGYDAANIVINLYKDGTAEERVSDIQASSYTLQNNEIIKGSVDKKSIYKEIVSKNRSRVKFTIPSVREGSIIEFQYEISSDFIMDVQPWYFQNKYYTIWSEYEADMPGFLEYIISETEKKYFIETDRTYTKIFNITQTATAVTPGGGFVPNTSFNLTVPTRNLYWVKRNIPAAKEEKYVWSLRRSMPKVEFQVSRITMSSVAAAYPSFSWQAVTHRLMLDENFGDPLNKSNNWLEDEISKIKKTTRDSLEQARAIYKYIRDNFSCKENYGIWLTSSLKNVFEKKQGNIADINLLLVAMLRKAGFSSLPVLLSTRSGGGYVSSYPLINKLDYVIAFLKLDGKEYFLDAGVPHMSFGKLKPDCFNGAVRLVDEIATRKYLTADSVKESRASSLLLRPDEKGILSGRMKIKMGFYESVELRNKIKEKGKEEYFSEVRKKFTDGLEIAGFELEGMDDEDGGIILSFDIKLDPKDEKFMYFNPMLSEGLKENPFADVERKLAIELPYATTHSYVIKVDLPENWLIDDTPKSELIKFNNEQQGSFEYKITKSEKNIFIAG